MVSKGVFYIGTGKSYFDEAVASARSVKNIHDIDTAIVTTKKLAESSQASAFDQVIVVDKVCNDLRDKVFNIQKSPYNKTVFLDSDTEVIESIEPLFSLLDKFDLAVAESTSKERVSIKGIPDAFPELNTGVMAFNKTESVNHLFADWLRRYKDQLEHGRPNDTFPYEDGKTIEEVTKFGRTHDQPPFRDALYNSEISFSILPEEYNFGRWGCSYAYSEVKILHGKKKLRDLLSDTINKKIDKRMYLGRGKSQKLIFRSGEVHHLLPVKKPISALLSGAWRVCRTEGLTALFKKGVWYLKKKTYM